MRVRSLCEHLDVGYDLLIVATLENPKARIEELKALGVSREQMVSLRAEDGDAMTRKDE